MSTYPGPLPVPTPETNPFWDAARRHELTLPRCSPCGRFFFFPRAICPRCLSTEVEWQRVSGHGTLHTFTVVHRRAKGFPLGTASVTAVVEVAAGPRLRTNLVGAER